MVAISILDTGIGIAPGDRDKVFEDFRQVDSTVARPYGGTGLGLSICRRLATILGGSIELVSDVGRGSRFTLVIADLCENDSRRREPPCADRGRLPGRARNVR